MRTQIRDPVHSFVSLGETELELLGTLALQRLRGISQLAMARLVYPGAVHTRFDHTLGVTHVAGMMADALELDRDSIEIVRLAALLHDIGHGPFSHVSEYALERYAQRQTLGDGQTRDKIHELVTALMIRHNPELLEILGQSRCEKVAKLLEAGYGERVLRSIVSGPLDADKQDYLLRDSNFCGVQYGVFDIHQLHRSLMAHGDAHDRDLMITPDGVHALEQYVLAKYYLTTNVYCHKVRLITDQMILRGIVLGVDKDQIEELHNLYAFDNTEQFTERYAQWDDGRFVHTFGRHDTDSKCGALLTRLRERKLLKRVFTAKPVDFDPDVREALLPLRAADMDATRVAIEAQIAETLARETSQAMDPDFVIYHAFDVKSVKEMSRNDEASMLVAKRPAPALFEDESNLFASISEGLKEEFVEIYGDCSNITEYF